MSKLTHRISPIVASQAILAKVGDMLQCEWAIVSGVTGNAFFRRGSKTGVVSVTRHAVQRSNRVINLVLNQAEVGPGVIEHWPCTHPGIELASLVFRVAAIALGDLIDPGVHSFLGG